jgi:hypothetical protein
MIWGEPFDHAAPIHRLSQIIAPINEKWPRDKYFEYAPDGEGLKNAWIANITPDVASLRRALRETLLQWLAAPARDHGYTYWGLKEVRLTIHHAEFLKWLFPNARFLFTYRDVLNSYRSVKGVKWFSVWPRYRVGKASYFAHHWRLLLEGFLDGYQRLGGILIPYEDLVAGDVDVDSISSYLGMGDIDGGVLERKVGARGQAKPELSLRERYVIQSIAGHLRERLGYTG